MSCGVGHRCGSDLSLLWLLYRLAVAALIQPPAWELPHPAGAALKRKRKKKKLAFLLTHTVNTVIALHVFLEIPVFIWYNFP